MREEQEIKQILIAETVDARSETQSVAGARKISFLLKRSVHISGNTAFSIEVSHDGTNWVTYNGIVDNIVNTNAQTVTRVASKTLSTATSALVALDMDYFCFPFLRVFADVTTDGSNDVWMILET